jgi:hypothetical protein
MGFAKWQLEIWRQGTLSNVLQKNEIEIIVIHLG